MTVLLRFIGFEFFKFNALYAGLRLGKVERAGHLHHFALILAPSTWLTDIRLLTSSRVVLWRPCYSLYYHQRLCVLRVLSGSRDRFEICKWRHIARPAEHLGIKKKKCLGLKMITGAVNRNGDTLLDLQSRREHLKIKKEKCLGPKKL